MEILFKGWHEFNGSGEWVFGYFFKHEDDRTAIFTPGKGSFNVIPESVSQYTGYNDENDEKVFGNDILTWEDWYQNMKSEVDGQGYGVVDGLASLLLTGYLPVLRVAKVRKERVIWRDGAWFMDDDEEEVPLKQMLAPATGVRVIGNAWKDPDILSGRMYLQKNRRGSV